MKLNKECLYDKLRKLSRNGAHHFTIEHTSQAVRVQFLQGSDQPKFELIMTTRVLHKNEATKIAARRDSVAAEAKKFRRWLQEWKDNGGTA